MKPRKASYLCCLICTLFIPFIAQGETVVIEGSDTLGAKMVPQLYEAFKAKKESLGVQVAFEIGAEGSSTGIASIREGTAQIGMSSREPSEKEIAAARAKGVDLRQITVAYDGIAIIANEANPIQSISLEDIKLIFSGDVTDWSGVSDHFGRISTYTRNTSSGTYAEFRKVAMNRRDYGVDTQKMAGNEQIAEEVANNPNGIGYVGLAYVSRPGLKVLPINGLMPDQEGYPIARPLYYIIDQSKPLSPLLNDFIGFTMSPEGQTIVERVHCIPLY